MLFLESVEYRKQEKTMLNIKSDPYIKNTFRESFLLAERFIDFYKENEWKLKSKQLDEYFFSNLKQISNIAMDLNNQYGKEKNDYFFTTFPNWEKTYNFCRQYCINLTFLDNIVVELKSRFSLKKINKPDSNLKKTVKYIINKLVAILSISKNF